MTADSFLDDAPWDGCEHGNYEPGCHGCWVALDGQVKKASAWQEALEEVLPLIKDMRIEIATLTPRHRDARSARLLEEADEWVRKVARK